MEKTKPALSGAALALPTPRLSVRALITRYLAFAPVLIIAAGLALRLYGYNFDDGQMLQPDERSIDMTVSTLGCCLGSNAPATWPSPLTDFFNAALAPMNPHTFNYGSLPFYLLAYVTRFVAAIGHIVPGLSAWKQATDLTHINWIGRWLSALFDTGSLIVIYVLARRVFDRGVALLTLFLCAFTVLEIQLSHFYAVDTILTFFVLLTLWAAVVVVQERKGWAYAVAGAAFGAALATKTSAAPLALAIIAAALLPPLSQFVETNWRTHAVNSDDPDAGPGTIARTVARARASVRAYVQDGAHPLNRSLALLLGAFVLTVIVFAVCEPYGLIDHATLLANIQTQNGIIVSHSFPVPYTIQYVGTTPYWYYIENLVLWDMGIPLGITALAGTLWAIYQNVGVRVRPAQLVLLLWVVPYFIIIGRFWAKFSRYMLPIMPVLAMFGAALLLYIVRQLRPRWKPAGWGLVAVVALGTMLWAVAFMHIYTVPNTRVAASKWICAHIPAGTRFSNEGTWDDVLPLQGVCTQNYQNIALGDGGSQPSLYDEDNAAKIQSLVDALTHDQYIIMSSERMVDSIPREPDVYPITTRYYKLLFHNRLNFRLVKHFVVHPQLGPWNIDDFSADESFHVYDHPDVRIFKRIAPISAAQATTLLTSADVSGLSVPEPDGLPPARSRFQVSGFRFHGPVSGGRRRRVVIKVRPPVFGQIAHRMVQRGFVPRVAAGGAEPGRVARTGNRVTRSTMTTGPPPVDAGGGVQDRRLMLSPGQWAKDQTAPTYDQMFPPHGFGMSHPILAWLVCVELLGLAAFPLVFWVFRGLRDRGWVIAKTVGVLLVGWLTWITVSLGAAEYTRALIWLAVGILSVAGLASGWRLRRELLAFVRARLRYLLWGEAIFLVGFFAFVLLRMWYPDLGHQFSPVAPANTGSGRMGEKQMELAFLNAVVRSRTFPPFDPFFAGGYLNYYYFGYVLVGTVCKATAIAPQVGFNLAVPMFFAMLVGTAFSIGTTLTRSVLYGFATSVFVGVIGNLNGLVQLIRDLQSVAVFHLPVPLIGGLLEVISGIEQVIVFHATLPPFDYWESTRLVPPVGSNFAEFPYFTYLFADLHPHLMAFPMTLGVVGLAVSLVLTLERLRWPQIVLTVIAGGFLLGAIAATNPWDFPTYLIALAIGVYSAYFVRRRRSSSLPRPSRMRVRAPAVGAADMEPTAIGLTRFFGGRMFRRPRAPSTLVPLSLPPVGDRGLQPAGAAVSVGSVRALLAATTSPFAAWLGRRQTAYTGNDNVGGDGDWNGRTGSGHIPGCWPAYLADGLCTAFWVAGFAFVALVLFLPFLREYHTVFQTGIDTVSSQIPSLRSGYAGANPAPTAAQLAQQVHSTIVTPLSTYWEIFGLFLFVLVSWLVLVAVRGGELGRTAAHWWRGVQFALYYREQLRRVLRARALVRRLTPGRRSPDSINVWLAGTSLALACIAAALTLWLLAFLALLAGLVASILWAQRQTLDRRILFILAVLLLPIAISAFDEVFFLRDFLAGSPQFRMNTVAKSYNQIWVLYAVAAGFALSRIGSRFKVQGSRSGRGELYTPAPPCTAADRDSQGAVTARPAELLGRLADARAFAWRTRVGLWGRGRMQFAPTGSHRWWLATFSVLLLGSLIYTYAGTVSRETVRANWIPEHSVPFTLDGMAFMKVAYPEDYAGISWLNAHVRGAPVVIEADGADYDWRSRVVQFTGLPTLFGGIHEPEQRYGDQLGPRQAALEAIYSARGPDVTSGLLSQFGVTGCPFGTPKAARCLARALLRRLDVSYVYVGSMERLAWPQGVTKFAGMPGLHLAFRDGNTAIYHVIGSAT